MIEVVSVNISEVPGPAKTPAASILLDSRGIAGDSHAGSRHPVSLVSVEALEGAGGECGANIVLKGFSSAEAAILDRFTIGEVVLEVIQVGRKDQDPECAIHRETGRCPMREQGIFCRVLNSGSIKAGDAAEHSLYTLGAKVITVSDRVSRGEYEDRGGPCVAEMLRACFDGGPWRLQVSGEAVPDEAEELGEAFELALDEQSDIIVTTGGTGLGPRDITPDTIAPLLDRTIPGIMEYIRVISGKTMPSALLSRSLAGVCRGALVYCLPGSVKAVRDYMQEIVKTLHHSLYTLRDIPTH